MTFRRFVIGIDLRWRKAKNNPIGSAVLRTNSAAGRPQSLEPEKAVEPLGLLLRRLDTRHGLFKTGRLELPATSSPFLGGHDEVPQPAAPILLWRQPARQDPVPCLLDANGAVVHHDTHP